MSEKVECPLFVLSQPDDRGEAAGGDAFLAVAGEQVVATEGADAGDVNRSAGQTATHQGVRVGLPKIEVILARGWAGS